MPARRTWAPSVRDLAAVAIAGTLDLVVWNGQRDLRWGGTVPVWLVPAATLVSCAVLLLLGRRHPRAAFSWQWVHALAGLAVPLYAPFAALLLALYLTARRTALRPAVVVLAACAVPFGVDSVNLGAATAHPVPRAAASLVLWALVCGGFWAAARRAAGAERRQERLRRVLQDQAERSLQEERLHLARELHDIVSHAVGAMVVQAAGARTLVERPDDPVARSLSTIEESGVRAVTELHRLLGLLRSAGLAPDDDADPERPGAGDVPALVEASRRAGMEVELDVDGGPRPLAAAADVAVYRIVQESLTNAVKHAGLAARCRVVLAWSDEALDVTVHDTSPAGADDRSRPAAPPPAGGGHGLVGLAERVTLAGGRLRTSPLVDGFLVHARLPVLPETSASPSAAGPASSSSVAGPVGEEDG